MEKSKRRSSAYFAALSRGIGPAGIRWSNQRAILIVVANQPGLSNAEISRRTGLAPQSVSAVLGELSDMGLMLKGEVRRGGGRGQPATPYYVDPQGAYALGAEIGWGRVEVSLVDLKAREVYRQRWTHDFPEVRAVFRQLKTGVTEALAQLPAARRERVTGLDLALPRELRAPRGLLPRDQAAHWAGIDPADEARLATGFEVRLVDDGSAACWAEYGDLPSPRPSTMLYLLVDKRFEAGLVAEYRLWEGATGSAVDLGTMLVTDRDGSSRFLHQIASTDALAAKLRAAGFDLESGLAEAAPVAARAAVDAWSNAAAHAMAQAIVNATAVIELESVAIEAELPPPVRLQLVERVNVALADLPSAGSSRPGVRLATLGRSGAARGAAILGLYRQFYSRALEHMEA